MTRRLAGVNASPARTSATDVERAAEDSDFLPPRSGRRHPAQGLPGALGLGDQRAQLGRLQREGASRRRRRRGASVKCFSITPAPSATPATATPTPIVWSDSPTSQPNSSRMCGMVRRLVFSGVAG